MLDREVERRREGPIGAAVDAEDHAAVGQGRRAREVRDEVVDEDEVVRVDVVHARREVLGQPAHVAQPVQREQYRRPGLFARGGGGGEFFPQGLEDGPCDVGVAGAELGEAEEREVGLEGDGEVVLGGEFEGREGGGVTFGDAVEEGGGVGFLDVFGWVRAVDGGVGGMCDC